MRFFNISFKIQNFIQLIKTIIDLIHWRIKQMFLWEMYYASLNIPKIKKEVPHAPNIQNEIIKELQQSNFNVVFIKIDKKDYLRFIKNAEYHKFPRYIRGVRLKSLPEKMLEHYLAAKLLNLSKEDIYIDIANNYSPCPEIYNKLYGCQVYRQDLRFPKGIHKNIIGSDASNMPINDSSITKMALHCSFEHFEKDSDIKFVKEANRVLTKGGKVCILPLYLFNEYVIQTDPSTLPKYGIQFDNDAMLYCVKNSREIRHGRFYDVPHFISRIRNNLSELKLTIYVVRNEKEINPSCYLKFIAFFEK